ncbi:ABC transporter substrate-binding protein [Alteromonadaceae bacterium BrNp21-10]|nr:ABC transporter substrate-binding protein [Alteromonadaceae bacterium BrNp21-10]
MYWQITNAVKCWCLILLMGVGNAHADTLTVGLGNFEPYFSNSADQGLFTDIINRTFALIPEHSVSYVFNLPNPRLVHGLNEQVLDGAANIFSQQQIIGCLTQPVFYYLNVAISKQNRQFELEQISDLSGHSIAAYQGATELLGPRYMLAVKGAKAYEEVIEPVMQAKLLSGNLVDISINDTFIFLHSLKKWSGAQYQAENYRFHDILPRVSTYMGFNKQQYCDGFDKAFSQLKASGELNKIYLTHLQAFGVLPQRLSLSYMNTN